MVNDTSHKRYRGYKSIILAMLILGVVGFAFLFYGQFQSDGRQGGANTTASSTGNNPQQDINPMTKASAMKNALSETMVNGRERATELASGIVDKADEMVKSTTEGLTDKVGQITNSTTDGLTDNANQMIPSGINREVSQVEQMANKSPVVFSDDTTDTQIEMSEKSAEKMAESAADVSKMAGNTFEARSGEQDTPMETVFSEQRSIAPLPMSVSADIKEQGRDAMDQKDQALTSSEWCATSPYKGKDMGTRYIVAVCETMSVISERTGVGMKDLIHQNPQVENPNLIYPNQELQLPPRS